VLVCRVLSGDLNYTDPGAQAYDDRHRARTLQNLRNRARMLGFGLVDLETGEAVPGAVS
jgi:transposase